MRPTLFVITLSFLVCGAVYAATPLPGVDGNRGNVTTFAPNGTKDGSTTVNSATVDMRNDAKWLFRGMSSCSYRAMQTTTKSGTLHTLPADTFIERGVNPITPFINFTGCKSGKYQRQ